MIPFLQEYKGSGFSYNTYFGYVAVPIVRNINFVLLKSCGFSAKRAISCLSYII